MCKQYIYEPEKPEESSENLCCWQCGHCQPRKCISLTHEHVPTSKLKIQMEETIHFTTETKCLLRNLSRHVQGL